MWKTEVESEMEKNLRVYIHLSKRKESLLNVNKQWWNTES